MPSKKIITPILGSNYYHIFNRGINRQNIFFAENNYFYFMQLLDKFLSEYISVLAYCLLPNHFHLVIKVNDIIRSFPVEKNMDSISKKKMESFENTNDEKIGQYVSNQFRRMFITYPMAINKQENRTGSLFDKNFKRLEITENEYLLYSIFYTHYNPEKHKIIDNFRDYKFSSYSAFYKNVKTKINKNLVFEIFEGEESFLNYHGVMHEEKEAAIME